MKKKEPLNEKEPLKLLDWLSDSDNVFNAAVIFYIVVATLLVASMVIALIALIVIL